jgi:hypothetical protein
MFMTCKILIIRISDHKQTYLYNADYNIRKIVMNLIEHCNC